jgi:hypothetical protein
MATVFVSALTEGRGVGPLSPQAIGILTGAAIALAFMIFISRRQPTSEIRAMVRGKA